MDDEILRELVEEMAANHVMYGDQLRALSRVVAQQSQFLDTLGEGLKAQTKINAELIGHARQQKAEITSMRRQTRIVRCGSAN